MPRTPTPQDDDRLLDWLYLCDKGKSFSEIASIYGVSLSTVSGQITRVRQDTRAYEWWECLQKGMSVRQIAEADDTSESKVEREIFRIRQQCERMVA